MAEKGEPLKIRALIERFRTSEHWAASLARDIIWVIAVVGGIALALYLICGAWPAVVTIESESMVPHMNVGDLVIVVEKDRFGDLQTWDEGKMTGYRKFGDYGDVIIYRPNGITDVWASVGLLPLSRQHPIIHRAITWTDAGQPEPLYINPYRGQVTPADYISLKTSNVTAVGYTVLYTGNLPPSANITPGTSDLIMRLSSKQYIIPSVYVVPGSGYVQSISPLTPHEGYITKGDNNVASDQGFLSVPNAGVVEPVRKEWIVGKALFVIPLIGLLPLHITEVVIVLIIAMVLYEWYLRSRERAGEDKNKARKSKKN
jgi:signal peptidase